MFSNYIKYGLRYSLRYILKYIIRVVIFFSIIYLISFLSGKHLFISNVQAMSVSGQNAGSQVWNVNSSTNYWYVNKSLNNYWNNWGAGYIYFNIGISKRSTDSVAPLVSPKSIVLSTNNSNFACSIGTSSVNNSTYVNQNYSVVCPVNLTNSGLTLLTINLMPLNNTPLDTFEIYFDGLMSFVTTDVNVSVDNSSSNNNRDQNFGNLINDNRNNANSNNNNRDQNFGNLINDNRDNTNKIVGSVDKNTEENKKTNDTLKDDNVDSSTNQGSSFFNDFNSGDEGSLTDIVSLPLEFVQHLNDTCQPFVIPTGKLGDITIPCLSSIWSSTSFAGIIHTASIIINGIICYKLLTSLFLFFKELKDPDDDKVEVMNL